MSQYLKNYANLVQAFRESATNSCKQVLYSQAHIAPHHVTRDGHRKWTSTTYGSAQARIEKIASFLTSIGVTLGTKVAILSATRPEWLEADFAILSAGGVVVSIYQSLPPKDVAYILFDSDTKVVFVENQEQLDKVIEILSSEYEFPETEERPKSRATIAIKNIIAFETTNNNPAVTALEDIFKMPIAEAPEVWRSLARDDLASIVYTSGTTGAPKGVMQTHGNHLSNVRQVMESNILPHYCEIMLFLPLAHSFAKLIGLLGFLTSATLKFPGIADRHTSRLNQKSLAIDMAESNACVIPVVPRILEKMKEAIESRSRQAGLGNYLLRLTLFVAKGRYDAKKNKRNNHMFGEFLYLLLAPLRKKIKRSLFGSKLKYVLSGGAKLAIEVAEFFDMLGIDVVEGYGLTETCVATNVNRPHKIKIGTVGPVLAPDIEVKIESDGEICYRGPNIATGYYGRKTATMASWDEEGWFHTGDLGKLDEDSYLTIVGRKKEIIVTSYGKNIAPTPIEDKLKSSIYIDQAVLIGEGRAFCIAIVVPNANELMQYAQKKKFSLDNNIHQDPKVIELIWRDVEQINHTLPNHEKIRKLIIAEDEFSIENGLLTPTFKIKRNQVLKKYANEIEALYERE